MKKHFYFSVIAAIFALSACNTEYEQLNQQIEASKKWAAELDAARKVNENWDADCSVDVVTNVRRCFAATFGKGTGTTPPFQVVYYNNNGPYISVGAHDFPGRNPVVRFDADREPYTVLDDGGVSQPRAQMNVVKRMLSAEVAFARYHSWPMGALDMRIDIEGFPAAWNKLQEYLGGVTAPGERITRP